MFGQMLPQRDWSSLGASVLFDLPMKLSLEWMSMMADSPRPAPCLSPRQDSRNRTQRPVEPSDKEKPSDSGLTGMRTWSKPAFLIYSKSRMASGWRPASANQFDRLIPCLSAGGGTSSARASGVRPIMIIAPIMLPKAVDLGRNIRPDPARARTDGMISAIRLGSRLIQNSDGRTTLYVVRMRPFPVGNPAGGLAEGRQSL
ncbi:MAG: hypothetical protein JWM91_4504 [Rhodospirillales bacterium]|nr:hypothetical protein [Rhodospirillales bacterium]